MKLARLALPLLLAVYPFALWFALTHWSSRVVALLALAVLALRARALREVLAAAAESRVALGAMLALVAAAALLDWQPLLLATPVVANAFAAYVFWKSLATTPLIERFARAHQPPELMPELVGYCRSVTRVWAAFLAVNAVAALGFALFAPLAAWALFTGLIGYLLMGALFAGEWLVRQGRVRAAQRAVAARGGVSA
jgi:uncharacterized membrane protein